MKSYNIDQSDITSKIKITLDVLKKTYKQALHPDIEKYLNLALEILPTLDAYTIYEKVDFGKYNNICAKILGALLNLDKNKASEIALDNLHQNKFTIKELYMKIFSPILYELGRLSHLNKITVAQEHYCAAHIQWIMTRLYPEIFGGKKNGLKFIGVCVEGELHEIGIRMICDFLEIEGWDTYFLGSNIPIKDFINTIEKINPDLIGISCTMTFNIEYTKCLITSIRNEYQCKNISIAVGGYAFNLTDDLWKYVGADIFESDADKFCNAIKERFK
ncbi:hypothetical protein AN639_11275 [Candidatus Epulonipiscium fishelsonii]|uniref:Uncharacterized protein n=2 Tax=Candidatus Epulonipiscium fishelsonii TaxID=77094 RepID=A0ACC8X983_9FIRM|nr:hypothetical protein AN396_11395 [Epulopiscium sp. SCG-B11WGA-EpuloA1]ONI38637.1 hypothetical protein AN396_10275 [Epulopiscium sp. SCG-B11WGA-EpuloA1]ONI43171.1 hypothetical protein AN639_11275 [Epulopiscium sp. SCG-B05WGA-EpuloA1]ONI47349.1 hypothetical protein AN644_00660 [Epulopiscium sp. SCG-C06WGA-EpuloA1]